MFRLMIFSLCIALMGCNAPSKRYRGQPSSTVSIDGSTFDVRIKDLHAEAIRTNVEYAPRFGPIRGRARAAIEYISGCDVADLDGDQAYIEATLSCGGGPSPVLLTPLHYQCHSYDPIHLGSKNWEDLELDCVPVRS
jgi:hypothetical protein